MNKLKAVIPIALALVFAATASVLLYNWMQKKTPPKEVVKVETTEALPVAVAALDLALGTQLDSDMIKTVPYLKDSLPPGYHSKIRWTGFSRRRFTTWLAPKRFASSSLKSLVPTMTVWRAPAIRAS